MTDNREAPPEKESNLVVYQYTLAELETKKAESRALFLAGKDAADIDNALNLRRGKTREWAHKNDWYTERDLVMKSTSDDMLQQILKNTKATFEDLTLIKEKAIDAVYADEVQPQKFSEAVNAYLNTLEVERKLKTDSLQLSFVTDVITVLKSNIHDKELLYKISIDLREVFKKYQESRNSNGAIKTE